MATAIRSHLDSLLEDLTSSATSTAELSVAFASHIGCALYRPGDEVPAAGSFWVWHNQHRPVHAAKVRFTTFPACAQCGEDVRYLPVKGQRFASEWLRRDPDFMQSLAVKRRKSSFLKRKLS